MSKVRIYVCTNCGLKYWPDPNWSKICKDCDIMCRMVIQDEDEPQPRGFEYTT